MERGAIKIPTMTSSNPITLIVVTCLVVVVMCQSQESNSNKTIPAPDQEQNDMDKSMDSWQARKPIGEQNDSDRPIDMLPTSKPDVEQNDKMVDPTSKPITELNDKIVTWPTSKPSLDQNVDTTTTTTTPPLSATISDTADHCKPQHVHISYGDSVFDINVMWATQEKCDNMVRYSAHPWDLEVVAHGKTMHFSANEYNSKGLQHLYRVQLLGLTPNTTYYYIPISNGSNAGPFYFQTPLLGNDWAPEFLMFGDLGIQAETVPSLVKQALTGKYTALFHAGDFAYDLRHSDGLVGDYFMKLIEPVATTLPYMTSPGNHEIDDDTFSHYRYRFAMPGSDWPIPIHKMWYSIDIGPVHFVSYSSEVFFTNYRIHEPVQRKWLIDDLLAANANRNKTPWIIAMGHRPMYCSTRIGDDCSSEDSLVRAGLEDIFYKLSVDIVIQAHEHNYERLWPMYKGQVLSHTYVDPEAPVQIITGAAGSRHFIDPFVKGDIPSWTAFRKDTEAFHSYGRLLVTNETHVYWEQKSMDDQSVIDSLWIIKHRNFTSNYLSLNSSHDEIRNLYGSLDTRSFLDQHFLAVCVTATFMLLVLLLLLARWLIQNRRKKSNARTWSRVNSNS